MKFYPDDYSFQNNLSFRLINRMAEDLIRGRMSKPGDPEINVGNFSGHTIADMINEIEHFAPEFSDSLTRTDRLQLLPGNGEKRRLALERNQFPPRIFAGYQNAGGN